MFECRACTLRCLRALAGDILPTTSARTHRPILHSRLPNTPPRRLASTSAAVATAPKDDYVPFTSANGLTVGTNTPSNKSGRINIDNERALKKELLYLPDPLKFAEHVHYTLRNKSPEKALDLCRLASKTMSCVVAWNHVINWHMQQRPAKISDAVKIYNEMKKRAQFPDAFTYMLLLRGLVGQSSAHRMEETKEENAAKAVAIYHSMSSPTSRVQPNIMHTNAVLKVCSFAFDMDAFWSVVGKIPNRGKDSADHITYSIILHALRHNVLSKNKDIDEDAIVKRRNQAVAEGRRIWPEIITRWRAGEVKIDEELVCAMGRLLLLSSRLHDWDDVLNLVQQTMNMERLVAPVGSAERRTEHVPQPRAEEEKEGESAQLTPSSQIALESTKNTPSAKVFKPIHPAAPRPGQDPQDAGLNFVKPANDTLSLLIETCVQMRAPKTASAYWELLTSPTYGLQPDEANYQGQLRQLRLNRASAQAARLIETMPEMGVRARGTTYRLAMAVCMRDLKNHKVLENAGRIVKVMEKGMVDVDVQTVQSYLGLALMSHDGKKIVEVLDRLDGLVHGLRSRLAYGPDGSSDSSSVDGENGGAEGHAKDRVEIVKFLQTMIGAMDTLMNRNLVPRGEFRVWHARRSALDSAIGRVKGRVLKRFEDVGGEVEGAERVERTGRRRGKGREAAKTELGEEEARPARGKRIFLKPNPALVKFRGTALKKHYVQGRDEVRLDLYGSQKGGEEGQRRGWVRGKEGGSDREFIDAFAELGM